MLSTRAALWRDRSLRFALVGGATVVTALFGVVRNKWVAEHLAASGLGVLGQVFAAQSWLGNATGMGLSLPIAMAVGSAVAVRDEPALRRTAWTALVQVGAATLGVVALGMIFAPGLSRLLLGTGEYARLIRIAMLGVAGVALYGVANGLFAGRSDVRAPLTFALVGGAVAVAVTFLLVPRAGLTGAAIGAAVMTPAGLAGAFWIHRRDYRRALEPVPRPRFDPATARGLIGVGSAALVLALVDQGTLLALRAHYLRANGIAANGLLQAALALSQQVSGVFFAYLASYAFGRISGARDAGAIREYTRRQWRPLVMAAGPAFALAMFLASPLLHLLYSDRFDPARPMMAWALLGEFCRVMTQVWALGALPLGGRRLWMPIGLAAPVAMASVYALLAPGAGLLALPLAGAAGGLFQLLVAGLLMSRRGVTPRAGDVVALAAVLAGLALLARAIAR